jgi:ankyrin repeat protein
LNYDRHKLREQLSNEIKHLKVSNGIKTLNLTAADSSILTASLEADLEMRKKKQFFNIDLEQILQKYLFDILIAYRSALTQLDQHGRNPLHYAALNKFTWCYKTIETILEVEKLTGLQEFIQDVKELQDLEWKSERAWDPKKYLHTLDEVKAILPMNLYNARIREFKEQIQVLIRAAVNAQDKNGHSPLHLAAYSGDFNQVKYLISKGADKNLRDNEDKTPLDCASTKVVMKYLTSLEDLAKQGDDRYFRHLVDSSYNPNQPNNEFMINSVHSAVLGKGGMLKTVLDCEGDPNSHEWNLYTPLHYAAILGNLADAELLINQGADTNACSSYKLTPLHMAAMNNHVPILKLLLENNAKRNAKDHRKRAPLHLAAKKGSLESVRFLMNSGVDIYAEDIRKWTALHYASFHSKR